MNSKRLREESPDKNEQSDCNNEFETKRGKNDFNISNRLTTPQIDSDTESENSTNNDEKNNLYDVSQSNEYFELSDYEIFGNENFFKKRVVDKNAPKSYINRFRNSLTFYRGQLDKIKEDLQNSSLKAYESSTELRRRAQLKTEETIADLKTLHGFDVNDDESILPPELQLEIEIIQKNSDALIEKTESYEQTLISESESSEIKSQVNEILAELDEKKQKADHWNELLISGSLKEKEIFQTARNEMYNFNLKKINEKISLFPFNAKKMDFVENNQDVSGVGNGQKIGQMKIKETIVFEKLNIFKFKEIETSQMTLTLPSRLFEILDNGTFVIGGFVTSTKLFHLFIFDPIKKIKKNELIFSTRIDEIFTFKNKIALSQRRFELNDCNKILKILDENLNVIKEKFTFFDLKYLDESHLYCISAGLEQKLVLYDLDLNEIKTDVVFQYDDPNKNFYIKTRYHSVNDKIDQFVKRGNRYIVNYKNGSFYHLNELSIFSEIGVLLRKITIYEAFVIDSENNFIISNFKRDRVLYCDSNGEIFKTMSLKRPKNDTKLLKQIKIDSADKLYFTQ